MPDTKPIDFVESEAEKRISEFDASRKFYRRNHFRVAIAMACLSALTTLLISIGQITHTTWITICALFTSAAMSVATAWEGFFKNKEMWVNYTDTHNKLLELRSDIRYARAVRGDDVPPQEVNDFYRRYEFILNDANSSWMSIRGTQVGLAGLSRTRGKEENAATEPATHTDIGKPQEFK